MGDRSRDEWVRLMTELAKLDRNAYREMRAEIWATIAARHAAKSPDEIATWRRASS